MNKTLSYNQLRSIHMKFLLLCGVGVLLWTNTTLAHSSLMVYTLPQRLSVPKVTNSTS